jgi:hypothetical protein
MQRGYFEVKDVPDVNPESILIDNPVADNKMEIDGITKTLGTGPDSIKIIKNFVDKNELKLLKGLCDSLYKDIGFNQTQAKEANLLILKYKEKIKNAAENVFNFKLEHDDLANEMNMKSNYLNGRKPNFATDVHTDTLTDIENNIKYAWSGHISNLLYLNDNYSGGELYFPQHKMKIKPEPGMLVSFPGNWFNRHGILPASDFRYAINIFLKISNFPGKPLLIK